MVKRLTTFILVTSLILIPYAFAQQKKYIHPVNIILMKRYPRPYKLKYPEVPRIDAKEALNLYKLGKAIFIACGELARLIPGALRLPSSMIKNPPRILRQIAKHKLIILYCA